MSRPAPLSVAVVGAGLAGLTAAIELQAKGAQVQVFEKSRGAGGRSSTRRHGDLAFDHGAQYFTARGGTPSGDDFRRRVETWIEHGVARRWRPRLVTLTAGTVEPKNDRTERFVGVPGMSSIAGWLASSANLSQGPRYETLVGAVERSDDGSSWRLRSGEEVVGAYDAVIIGTPAAQAVDLLATVPELAASASRQVMQPCHALMLAFDEALDLSYDAAFVSESPLSWIARNSSKPGRPDAESWVLHASPEWSEVHLEAESADVESALLSAFVEATGCHARPSFGRVHRWRYAKAVEQPELSKRSYLWDAEARLGACGDWCVGARVESAVASGVAMARCLVT